MRVMVGTTAPHFKDLRRRGARYPSGRTAACTVHPVAEHTGNGRPARHRRRPAPRVRRRRAAVLALLLLVIIAIAFASCPGGKAATTSGTHPAHTHPTVTSRSGPPSIEAGVAAWQLPVALSRESVVAAGGGFSVLGGLTPSSASLATVYTVDPITGSVAPGGTLPDPVHDAGAVALGSSTFVLGGGSPNTVATIQSLPTALPSAATATGSGAGSVSGQLPRPRSDLAIATMHDGRGTVAYVVGGYDGTNYLPGVLATTDGVRFSTVANLTTPVRYPALAADGGMLYAFGGQTESAGTTVAATDDIQAIDPVTHRTRVVGHLPQPLYGAAAFVIDGTIYVAGGQAPGGPTLTQIEAFVPATGAVLDAGLLPQADAFAGYTTVGSGSSAIGYLVGGEVAAQSGPDQGGVASGTLSSVISLRPSRYGGPAGPPGAGSPYSGTLLIADRGNDRLLALDTSRTVTWQYPSTTMPPPPGGFYFPDDAFFIRRGSGIISNQEDNHTIVEIGYPSGKTLWQYGHPMQPGAAPGYLDQPDDAYLLKSGIVTVADASNNRILFLSPSGQVVGQIGNGTDLHDPPASIAYPNGDTPLADGDVLVSEINGSWVDEYTQSGQLVWTVHIPSVVYPSDPQQLGPDLFLMTDYDPPAEGKVLEFTRSGQTPWVYDVRSGDGDAEEALAGRAPPQRAGHGQRRLPQPGGRHRSDARRHRVAVRAHRRGRHRPGVGLYPRRVRPPAGQRHHPDPSGDRLSVAVAGSPAIVRRRLRRRRRSSTTTTAATITPTASSVQVPIVDRIRANERPTR